jgi:integrase
LLTGARIGEVLALNRNDITPAGLVIDESALEGRASTTKNRKTRTAVLTATLRRDLLEWAEKQFGPLIFPKEDGRMDRRNTRANDAATREIRQLTGIADLTPRMCRTTFATHFEGDPSDIRDLLGHASLDTTAIYKKPIAPRQQAAVEEYEARLTGKVVEFKPKEKIG